MKLIILDRDGVINHDSCDYIKSPEEWEPIPGSLAAIAKLYQAGWCISVATNQSGIARGLYTEQTLAAIHDKMQVLVTEAGGKIDSIFYCPHHPADNCACRKPKPGLLEQIAKHYRIKLSGVPFIGDKWSDAETGLVVGCLPILVTSGLQKPQVPTNNKVPMFANLAAAVNDYILRGTIV